MADGLFVRLEARDQEADVLTYQETKEVTTAPTEHPETRVESQPILSAVLDVAAVAAEARGAHLERMLPGQEATNAAPLGVDDMALVFDHARTRELGLLDGAAHLVRQAWVWSQVASGSRSAGGRLRRDNFVAWLAEKLKPAVERAGTLSLLMVTIDDKADASLYGTTDLEDLVPNLYNAVETAVRGIDSVYRCDDRSIAAILPRCDRDNMAKVAGRVTETLRQVAREKRTSSSLEIAVQTYACPGDLLPLALGLRQGELSGGEPEVLTRMWVSMLAGANAATAILLAKDTDAELTPMFSLGADAPTTLCRSIRESFLTGQPRLVTAHDAKEPTRMLLPVIDGRNPVGLLVLDKHEGVFSGAELEIGRHAARVMGPLLSRLTPLPKGHQLAVGPATRRFKFNEIIGESPAMTAVYDLLERVIDTEYPVIIQGESGTGKELVARAIHYNGPRRDKPLIAENCAALNDNLLEAELFGYEKGSFTGAETSRKGLFELADGGTLFLDEVADMKPSMQKDLLRILQEGVVRPVGGKRFIHVNVRVICACNRDLKQLVDEGKFRADLYYRLNVWNLHMPALRERREDIPTMVNHFLGKIAHQTSTPHKRVGRGVMDSLCAYDWPGNVRELKNEIARMVAMSTGEEVQMRDFSKRPSADIPRPTSISSDEILTLADMEKLQILRTLRFTNGNRSRAADLLGINKATIYRKLKAYGIE